MIPDRRIKIVVRLPEPEPDPPPKVCAICGKLEPYWHFSIYEPPICTECFRWKESLSRGPSNWKDATAVAAVRTVIHHLEAEIARQ